MSFPRRVELLLEKKNPKLSSFIFEEKKDDKKDKEESAGGLFDMKDEEEESSDNQSDEDEDKSSEEAKKEPEADVEPEDNSSEVTRQQIETLTSQIEAIRSTIDKVNSDDGTQSIESFIAGIVAEEAIDDDINESYYCKDSISSFLLIEDESLKDIEKNIDVLDRVLTKGTDLVDKFKKGKEINISTYVTAAINAYKNFDNLFAKEKIIKQATINVLILNSGAKAETNIKEFEELFHEELHKQFDVEYPEYALVTKSHNTAVGAVKQG